jgi:hypothetical protein
MQGDAISQAGVISWKDMLAELRFKVSVNGKADKQETNEKK